MFGPQQHTRPIPIRREDLQRICNPFEYVVWHRDLHKPLTQAEVRQAIEEGRLQEPDRDRFSQLHQCSRRLHIERIAWLVVNGWNRSIELDLGSEDPTTWIIRDGNHRMAAAIVRGDEYIQAYVDGSMGRLQELFIIADDEAPR